MALKVSVSSHVFGNVLSQTNRRDELAEFPARCGVGRLAGRYVGNYSWKGNSCCESERGPPLLRCNDGAAIRGKEGRGGEEGRRGVV